MKRIKYTKRMMVLLSAIVLMGCSSGGGGDDTEVVDESTELSLTDDSLDVISGATSSLTVSAANALKLTAVESVAAKDIKFYFDEAADESKFSIDYGADCSDLESSESCVIEFSPKADSGYEKEQTISGWIEGSNTPKYPLSFTVEEFALSSDSNVIGAGEALGFTLSHSAGNTISNIELATSSDDLSVENSTCEQELAAAENCQFDVRAASSATDQSNVGVVIGGVNYALNWALSVVRPVLTVSADNDLLQASSSVTITVKNDTSVEAHDIDLDKAASDLGMDGISIDKAKTTCTSTLAANSQCQLVLSTDETLKPDLTGDLVLSGSNFDDTDELTFKSYADLSIAVSPVVITANSGVAEAITLTLTNNSGADVNNLAMTHDSSRLSFNSTASTCSSLLADKASCQYVFAYDPGTVSAYNLLQTIVNIDSDEAGAMDKVLDIHSFKGFYTIPADLYTQVGKLLIKCSSKYSFF
ncbi:MAG: hypothetical protein ACO2ZM_09310, partial [Francisellaceae bacterium]